MNGTLKCFRKPDFFVRGTDCVWCRLLHCSLNQTPIASLFRRVRVLTRPLPTDRWKQVCSRVCGTVTYRTSESYVEEGLTNLELKYFEQDQITLTVYVRNNKETFVPNLYHHFQDRHRIVFDYLFLCFILTFVVISINQLVYFMITFQLKRSWLKKEASPYTGKLLYYYTLVMLSVYFNQ